MSESSESFDRPRFVRVGRVSKPHGIKGELKVIPDGEVADFADYPELLLGSDDQPVGKLYQVRQWRPQGQAVLLQLEGVDDRNDADLLAGRGVWTEEKYLAALADDEFYWHEMVGLRVVIEGGRELGRVTGLFATGGHDVLVVHGSGKEYLIPARREFMLATDIQGGLLTVSDIPGLFDLNG